MATIRQRLENSLKNQLKRKGADEYHFSKLIDDYLMLFDIKEKLKKDIEERGVTVEVLSARGVPTEKANPSITEITKVSSQMLKILDKLSISPGENISGDDDEL